MLELSENHIMSLKPYIPGRAIENDTTITSWAKLGSNENCLGASKEALLAAEKSLVNAHIYPNAKRILVIDRICQHLGDFSVKKDNVALGNGTSEIIVNLIRGLVGPKESILYAWPSFVVYRLAAQAHGRKAIEVQTKEDFSYNLDEMLKTLYNQQDCQVKLLIIANPNNPSGLYVSKNTFESFISEIPKDVVIVIDEAYFEYVVKDDYPNSICYAMSRPRTIVIRTFSKIYGLAGLRLGYAVGDEEVISILCRVRDPFNVNSVVQHAAMAALDDQDHVKNSINHNLIYKPLMSQGLRDLGFYVQDGVGNFVIAKRNEQMPSIAELSSLLLTKGVIIRPLDPYALDDFMRVTVGTKKEIAQLLTNLEALLKTL